MILGKDLTTYWVVLAFLQSYLPLWVKDQWWPCIRLIEHLSVNNEHINNISLPRCLSKHLAVTN